jgi:hypothetical protein
MFYENGIIMHSPLDYKLMAYIKWNLPHKGEYQGKLNFVEY